MLQTDIFTIAQSGLNAQQSLINTTANNIANVNTEGYVKQRGTLESQSVGGVLFKGVERQINRFAYEQNIRDTSSLGEATVYLEKVDLMDNLLASESNSIAAAMSRFFASLQTATDNPNNLSSRQLVIAQAEAMVGQINTLDGYYANALKSVNDEIGDTVDQVNDLIEVVSELNEQLKGSQFAAQTSGTEALKNERDQAIKELAQYVEIDTIPRSDGSTLVNLVTGQPLILEDGTFNLFSLGGDPDITRQELELTVPTNSNISIPLGDLNVGGEIGGLLRFRDEVLENGRRDIGQMSLALADALNEQNKLGMDLDGALGGDIFTIPTFTGLAYQDNADSALGVNARMPDGSGNAITSADYRITIDAVTTGAPDTVDITVEFLNPDGTAITDSSGNPVTQTLLGVDAAAGTYTTINGGLEVEFPDQDNYTAGDQFLLQPTKGAASSLEMNITRPEDLAFAAPVRVESSSSNLGNATISSTTVTNTFVDATNADPDSSAFTGAGGLQGPGASPDTGGLGAPTTIVFTGADSYEVRDSAGTVITTVTNATTLENILAYAETNGAGPAWDAEFSALNDYPGYDFSIDGVPQAGDTFTVSYNTNGFNDNSNGRQMAALQDADTVLQSNNGSSTTISFNEAYSSVVNNVGTKAASAEISYDATLAMERQSGDWFNSVSGVSLDEEAADLIRFQQAYTASARVLSTAQSLFETILGAVR
ncbi:MAG: flagellar hook-associated protein FlgK [Aestuariibacter sp.]